MANKKIAKRSLSKMPSWYPDINQRFRETREEKGLTQKGMAEILETTESTVKAIEYDRATPNIQIIRLWSKRLNKPYKWIIDGQ